MEVSPESSSPLYRFIRAARTLLSTIDLNPHEGRLRSSVMPVEYMAVPDDVSELEETL